jgi:hypothetical protein
MDRPTENPASSVKGLLCSNVLLGYNGNEINKPCPGYGHLSIVAHVESKFPHPYKKIALAQMEY